jgi:PIN domain nuclease of toxin-antitoxin system
MGDVVTDEAVTKLDSVLLDTHIFLWWMLDNPQLSATARALIASPGVRVFVSAATVWEIAIKNGKGKLNLPEPVATYIPNALRDERFEMLPITVAHALETAALPFHHSDPFDRILAAQSRAEGLPLVSADAIFDSYDVAVVR